ADWGFTSATCPASASRQASANRASPSTSSASPHFSSSGPCGSIPTHSGPSASTAAHSRAPNPPLTGAPQPTIASNGTPPRLRPSRGAVGADRRAPAGGSPRGPLQRRVRLLQRPHADPARLHRLDPLHGGGGALHGRDARDALGHGRRADLVPVDARAGVAVRGVDDHVDGP